MRGNRAPGAYRLFAEGNSESEPVTYPRRRYTDNLLPSLTRSDQSGFPGIKRFLLGKPIPSHLAHHERLSRVTGLAVLSSDALSSVAYATDFILITLLAAGTQTAAYAVPISI